MRLPPNRLENRILACWALSPVSPWRGKSNRFRLLARDAEIVAKSSSPPRSTHS